MDTNKLTWVEFYTEFATRLLSYKNDRKNLIAKLQKVYQEIEMKFPKMESDGTILDIDPFTIFGLFNKGITNDNRKLILGGIAKEFEISEDIPSDFDGIPVLNNQKATFFHFVADRQESDISNLWDMFEIAIKYAENSTDENKSTFEKMFDKAVQQKGVRWNITMGLYWVRPNTYINLDSRNREFIITEQILTDEYLEELNNLRDMPSGKQYCELCHTVSGILKNGENSYKNFPEFSLAAWTTTKSKKEDTPVEETSDSTYWPSLEEYNPNISADEWVLFLQEDKKSYPSTLEMLKAMLELGGEATCKRVAELLGEHPSSCVSRGNTLGRRAKNQFNLPPCMDGEKERYFPVAFVGRNVTENGQQLYAWKLRPELKEALESMNLGEVKSNEETTDVSKNTILYGPPGTGKTYNTVVYAVAIIENKKLQAVKDEDYDDVLARYNEYKADGLIEFTTFHQSYGYEEFIEGIKPIMDNNDDEQNDIQYQISSGLFKSFCDKAGRPILKQKKKDIGLNSSPTIWKVSLEGTGDNPTRKECMDKGHIRIGYDSYGEKISSDTNFADGGKNVINAFIYKMKVGDIVLSCYSATTIDAIGVVTGEYEWHDEYEHYKRLRKVNWLVKGISEDITEINNGSTLTLSSVYKLNVSLADVMDIVTRKAPATTAVEEKKKNYVFVIDEINRGNISKIFGELITLIEPTKRIGQPEGMKAKLPYSQQPFGVPDNVYLIGTMNTADRSIAAIDTALRRRFRFKEMLPDAEVLDGIYVDDISIKDMLVKMNKRIAVLYDREHTLGHAYFLPLKTKPTVETLAGIFADSIIPLLQEYFYEDYEKIRLVLGDNNKPNPEEQFIIAVANDYNELFGSTDYGFDEASTYEINAEAFENIEAYRLI